MGRLKVWTLGHSNRPLATFLELVRSGGLGRIVDVRRFPRSRWPQFSGAALAQSLAAIGVDHVHLVDLGGRREPRADSRNLGLREPAFRGYADHMQSREFAAAFERLLELAREAPTAVLCSEARWQDCHRRLLADRLSFAGVEVVHLAPAGAPEPHVLTGGARFAHGRITYPDPGQRAFDWSGEE